MKQFIAAKGFVTDRNGRVLIIREAPGYAGGTNIGKYDFPGGKIKPGETYRDALKREALEECGLDIKVGKPIYVDEWRPVISGEEIQIIGVYFACEPKKKKPSVTLAEQYDDHKWITPEEHTNHPIIDTNRKVFEAHLQTA